MGLGELVAEFSVNAENFWEVARMRILSADLGDESMNPIDLLEELKLAVGELERCVRGIG